MKKKPKMKSVYVYTWTFNNQLCRFASASKEQLIRAGKPTPEAKIVRVRMGL